MNYIIIGIRFLYQSKWKILLFTFLTGVFLFVLFPFGDLNDYISTQVSNLTNKGVFLQFEDMHINPATTTLTLEKVFVETQGIENLAIDKLSAAPSFLALIKQKPGGQLKAEGLFKGTADFIVKPAKSESGIDKSDLELTLTGLDLKDVRGSMSLPVSISGRLNLQSKMLVDLAFGEQPEGDINLQIQKFEMPSSSINTGVMGNFNLPELKFATIELKGRMSNGKFLIESGRLGTANDDFSGTIKGEISITLQNMNGRIQPLLGAYKFDLDLVSKPAFTQHVRSLMNVLNIPTLEEAGGQTRYKFSAQAQGLGVIPRFDKMN